jgi:hypothetical protein
VHSASPAPAVSPNSASIRQVSQQPDLSSVPTQSIHHHDQTRQSTSHDGVAAPLKPHDEQATIDLSLTDPQTPTMASFVRTAVQRPMTVPPEMAAAQPERSRTMPLPSTSYMASPSGNVASTSVADSHPAARLRENSLVRYLFFQDDIHVPINEPSCASAARTDTTETTYQPNVCPSSFPILQTRFCLRKCRPRSSHQSRAHGN